MGLPNLPPMQGAANHSVLPPYIGPSPHPTFAGAHQAPLPASGEGADLRGSLLTAHRNLKNNREDIEAVLGEGGGAQMARWVPRALGAASFITATAAGITAGFGLAVGAVALPHILVPVAIGLLVGGLVVGLVARHSLNKKAKPLIEQQQRLRDHSIELLKGSVSIPAHEKSREHNAAEYALNNDLGIYPALKKKNIAVKAQLDTLWKGFFAVPAGILALFAIGLGGGPRF